MTISCQSTCFGCLKPNKGCVLDPVAWLAARHRTFESPSRSVVATANTPAPCAHHWEEDSSEAVLPTIKATARKCDDVAQKNLPQHEQVRCFKKSRQWRRLFEQLTITLAVAVAWQVCQPATATAASVNRHPISVTEAQIFVTRNNARMRVKLFAEDLFLFEGLEADDMDMLPPEELRRGLELHRDFLLRKITLRDSNGEAYKGKVTDLQPFEIPNEGIPVTELMLHTATYELEFAFDAPPEFLTIQQDISDENFIIPSEMKLTLHQSGTDLTYTENLKPGASETLRFDWSGEQLSDEATDADWDAWFEKQREATLGITSYSSVYSFIYIEPAEVRHEVLIPLANLKTILPLEHKDPAFVEIDEQDGVRELIKNWLTGVNPTKINGVAVLPEFTRIDFYGLDLKDFAQQADAQKVSLANGRVGIIMTYRTTDDSVTDVNIIWDKFHPTVVRKINSVIFSYPNQLSRFEFSVFNKPEENIFTWTVDESALPQPAEPVAAKVPPIPMLTVPAYSIVGGLAVFALLLFRRRSFGKCALTAFLVAGALLSMGGPQIEHPFKERPIVAEQEAREVFETLHKGAYRALDFGTEARIYEVLETAVDGDLLETIYLQLRESLAMREQGGAVARVRAVEYIDEAEALPADPQIAWPGFQFRSRWTVSGTVEHWGHVHERQNQFCALFSIEPRDGFWKITNMQIEEQESKASKTELRKF